MEEKRFKSKQCPSKFFSVKQKHQIIKAFLEGGKSKREVWQEFTGEPKEKGQILKYMRQLGYIESAVSRKPVAFYMNQKKNHEPRTPQITKEPESDDVNVLKKQLQNMYLREQYYLTLIETAEEELKIDIRKKSYTK